MPNWVYNEGTIMCSNSNTAEKFLCRKNQELLNFIKPIPIGYSYSWGIENWASKWMFLSAMRL